MIGVFARVYADPNPSTVAARVADSGFATTQLNLVAFGRPTLGPVPESEAAAVREAFEQCGVGVWGVSGTFNAIDPDREARRRSIVGCQALIERCPDFGASVVTLCTGTNDHSSMWRPHPENGSPQSWRELRTTLEPLLTAAEQAGVRLGIEPEPANVVNDARAAARLLAELDADAGLVTIVIDPAGLVEPDRIPGQAAILTEAFDLLGPHIGALHAKDVSTRGICAAGTGELDYALVARLHAALPRRVPVIAQDLEPQDGSRVAAFLRESFGP